MTKPISTSTRQIQNANAIGFSGKQRTAQVFVVDEAKPAVVAKSSGDIFVNASKELQMTSKTAWVRVDKKRVETYGELSHHVVKSEKARIEGDNEITVDGLQKIHVKKQQKLHVVEKREILADAGQDFTIKKGHLNVTLNDGNMTEKIKGEKTTEIGKKADLTFIGDFVESIMGKFSKVKASSSSEVTLSEKTAIAVSQEASLNVGTSEKVNVGASMEINVAKKYAVTLASETSLSMGVKKEKNMVQDVNKSQMKVNKAVTMWKMNAPLSGMKFKMANVAATLWCWK